MNRNCFYFRSKFKQILFQPLNFQGPRNGSGVGSREHGFRSREDATDRSRQRGLRHRIQQSRRRKGHVRVRRRRR